MTTHPLRWRLRCLRGVSRLVRQGFILRKQSDSRAFTSMLAQCALRRLCHLLHTLHTTGGWRGLGLLVGWLRVDANNDHTLTAPPIKTTRPAGPALHPLC